MKILAVIFYFLAFIGIMTVAHVIPKNQPIPIKPIPDQKTSELVEPVNPLVVAIDEIKTDVKKSDAQLQKIITEVKDFQKEVTKNTPKLERLNRKLDEITTSTATLSKQNSALEKRLTKIEARPLPVTEPQPLPAPITTAPSTPAPKPTPQGKAVSFSIGSMDFSEPAVKTLKKVAAEMGGNEQLMISLRGSTSGFGTSLGKGRAEAVKAKLAEFGVAGNRITISKQTQGNGDSVSVSFRKKK